MDLRVTELNLSLSQEQKDYLAPIGYQQQASKHHTPDGRYFGLDIVVFTPEQEEWVNENIVSKFAIKPRVSAITLIEPHIKVVPHKDPPRLGRISTIIFPIAPEPSENYAPCNRMFGQYPNEDEVPFPHMDCYIFDTQTRHSVNNNEHRRLNLQLWYMEPYDELVEAHKSGELLI